MNSIFTEYIRILLLRSETNTSHKSSKTRKDDICSCHVSSNFFDITSHFFEDNKSFDLEEITKSQNAFSRTETNNINYFKCTNTFNLYDPFITKEQMNKSYSKLLCMCLGHIIDDFLTSNFSEGCNIYFLDALQKISIIYNNIISGTKVIDNRQYTLLYKFYFYICLCIQSSITINSTDLINCFNRIPHRKDIFDEVFDDIFQAVFQQTYYKDKDLTHYKHEGKYNYLVYIWQFLRKLYYIKDEGFNLSDEFTPILQKSDLEICQFSEQKEYNRGMFFLQLCKTAMKDTVTS